MKTKVKNNQDAIARSIERFGKQIDSRITAVGDDGNVCVNAPTLETQKAIAKIASEWHGNTEIGDGCQAGAILVNCDGFDTIEVCGTNTDWIDAL